MSDEPRLAKRAHLNPRTARFEIDGEVFPYWIGSSLSIEADVSGLTQLVLRVPLEHGATVDDEWEPE